MCRIVSVLESLVSHVRTGNSAITDFCITAVAWSTKLGIEDYLWLVRNLAESSPDLVFLSSVFSNTVQIAISAITLLSPNVCHEGLDTIRVIVGHDCLRASSTTNQGSNNMSFPTGTDPQQVANWDNYAAAIRSVISQPEAGGKLVQILLSRLVTDFSEDCAPMSVTLARLLAERFPQELAQWVPAALSTISPKDLREPERQKFIAGFSEGMSTGNLGKVRNAWTNLDRASRKERERMSLR